MQDEPLISRGAAAGPAYKDVMDIGIAQWRRERPDLDPSAKAITGRILRLHDVILRAFNTAFTVHGLKYPNYAVLATLRSAGEPYEMTPTHLQDMMVLTSGGLSKLLARIEKQGLIERKTDTADRRSIIVKLTAKGRAVADSAMATQAKVEHELIASLAPDERELMAGFLQRIVLTNGGRVIG